MGGGIEPRGLDNDVLLAVLDLSLSQPKKGNILVEEFDLCT